MKVALLLITATIFGGGIFGLNRLDDSKLNSAARATKISLTNEQKVQISNKIKAQSHELEKARKANEASRIALNRKNGMSYKSIIDSGMQMCVLMNDTLWESASLERQLGNDNAKTLSDRVSKSQACKASARRQIKTFLKYHFPELKSQAMAYYSAFAATIDNPQSRGYAFTMQSKKSELQAQMDFLAIE
jgi:hypothetical protein